MAEANDRDFAEPQLLRGLEPSMSGNHLILVINQNRVVEPKRLNALSDLMDLLSRVSPGVAWVGFEITNCREHQVFRRRWSGSQIFIGALRLRLVIHPGCSFQSLARAVALRTTRQSSKYDNMQHWHFVSSAIRDARDELHSRYCEPFWPRRFE